MYFYFKNNKLLFTVTTVFNVVSSILSVLFALLLQRILDIAITGETNQFLRILIFSLGYFVVLAVSIYIYTLTGKKLTRNILETMRKNIFNGIIKRNMEDFSSVNSADYLSVLNNDIKLIEENYIQPFLSTIQNIVLFIASIILMIYFDPFITLIMVLASVLMLVIPGLFGKALQNRQNEFSKKMAAFMIQVKDFLSGFEVIKTYRMEKHVQNEFDNRNRDVAESKYAVDKLLAANEGVSTILALMVQAVAIFMASYFIITGRITAGTMLGLIQVSNNIVNPIVVILQNFPKVKSSKLIVERLSKYTNNKNESFSGAAIPSFENELSVVNLGFFYKADAPILKNISVDFEKGKKYAIIGKSGCGKTTLARLLSGYYSHYEGKILYDNSELHLLDIKKINDMSAIIHQNIYMFDDTIKENICLHKQYTDQELEYALQASGVDMFLDSIKSLMTSVGENGSNLSGGQRQRIAVARALIQKKPVLILDEGTSAIDMKTAYDIESRLLAMSTLTLITITHSLNPNLLQAYDKIILMENGTISAIGAYNELMRIDGPFTKYCDLKEYE